MLFWMRSKTYMSKINLQAETTVENRKSREKSRRPVLASHHCCRCCCCCCCWQRYTSCLVGALLVSRRIKPAPSVAIRQCTLQTNRRRHWTFYLSLSLSLVTDCRTLTILARNKVSICLWRLLTIFIRPQTQTDRQTKYNWQIQLILFLGLMYVKNSPVSVKY